MTNGLKRAALIAILCAGQVSIADNRERHVVLVVWDGMRPDFVTEQYAPALSHLGKEGVIFRNHHSVYPTATNVNGAVLATGCYPNRNGIVANLALETAINPLQPVDTAEPNSIRRGDQVSGGKYVAVSTFVEQLRSAGKKVALVGSKSVTQLFDPKNNWTVVKTNKSLTAFAAASLDDSERDSLTRLLGPFPNNPQATAKQRNDFATHTLIDFFWREGVPDFSLLWLSEPDLSQHNHAPGSPEGIAAIKAVDQNLAELTKALDQKHVRDSTDLFVVSDHGFSTINRSIDVVDLLNKAGFRAAKEFSSSSLPGDVLVAGNAGSLLFYVNEHTPAVVRRLVEWLGQSDFAGIIFADGAKGTVPLAEAYIDATAGKPDVAISFRWYSGKNHFGVPGLIDADWNRPAGEGTHATLSPYDVHNTLIAAGPDLRRGFEDELPSGNVDLAPTILRLLGIAATHSFDGRELTEAYLENQTSPTALKTASVSGAKPIPGATAPPWPLTISTVGDHKYIDRANR